jgi:hypothetical protein
MDWILAKLVLSATTGRCWVSGETLPYLGSELTLLSREQPVKTAKVSLEGGDLVVDVPRRYPEAERPAVIEAKVRAWYRERATAELTALVTRTEARVGSRSSRVLVRDQKRRWGSCGTDGTIRLNWRLVMVEPALAEYVAVHELAHLAHKHHRPEFWDEVRRYIPDHIERRRRLNELGRTLPFA